MPSLIPGHNYDIFISYRQKDNKGDRWVSEFVDALRTELESTFKEDISVYFDINPHDGLLETHDVDASLKDKLKCLIFIPIISRTYCDPKSFAWEHEFKAFIDQASKDRFGLKVKLPNGNVASRILPIQIHDLYPEDKSFVEKELGGALRAIEFIYKEPGVNKALTALDNEKSYRIQINKVANAIAEIILGLRSIHMVMANRNSQPDQKETVAKKSVEIEFQKEDILYSKNIKRLIVSVILILLCIAGIFGILKIIEIRKQADDIANLEKSIAVLPFVNDSPDKENEYFCNGMMDEILINHQRIKEFTVLSRTSTEQFRGANKLTISEIGKELDVNYIIEGSVQKYGNTFRLRVQLIAANNEKHLWGESYEQEINETKDIFTIQSQVAQTIASELEATITPEEKQIIEKTPTSDLTAYDFYQRGSEEFLKYWLNPNNREALEKAEDLYRKALKFDSTFAQAYTGLAKIYWNKNLWTEYFSKNFMDSVLILTNVALSFDNHLAEAYTITGNYYLQTGKPELAIKEYDKAIRFNPNSYEAYYEKGNLYVSDDLLKCIENLEKAASINRGSELPEIFKSLSWAYYCAGFIEKNNYCIEKALKLDRDSVSYYSLLANSEFWIGNYNKSIDLYQNAYSIDSTTDLSHLAFGYSMIGKYKESLRYFKKWDEFNQLRGIISLALTHRIGYVYWQNGYRKEADYYFDKQIEYCDGMIKADRPWAQKYYAFYDLAGVYAFRGEREKAYKNLKIFNQRPSIPFWMERLIKSDPLFDSIRDEQEFREIVLDVEAKYQSEHERVRKWLEEQGKL